jgi:hypothetical protein
MDIAEGDDDSDDQEVECRYINHGQLEKVSVQMERVRSVRRGWVVGTKYRGGAFPIFPSFFRIIKPIYNDIPFPSTLQKSISGVF